MEEAPPNPSTKSASVALKIYEPEWLLIHLIREKRNALAKGEIVLLHILIEPSSKDITILDIAQSKRIVLAAA